MAVDYTDNGIDPESGLTLKQRTFVDSYMTHLNGTRAYREAGYAADSYDTARKEASTLLNHPHVSGYVGLRMRERRERLAVTADRVLLELCVVAYARPTDYRINQDTGELEVKPGVPQEALGAVRTIKVVRKVTSKPNTDGTTTTETTWTGEWGLHDKMKGTELLCRHLGLVAAELPPLEVLLNRLPPNVANVLRQLLAAPPGQRPPPSLPEAGGTEGPR